MGYKKAYIYYSYSSLILAKLVGCQTFFWHCYWNAPKTLLLKLCLQVTDYLVTGTKSSAANYRNRFNLTFTKIKVLPSWINLKKFYIPKIDHSGKTVLFYPRLTLSKGSDWLPEIVKKLGKHKFDIIDGAVPNSEIPIRLAASDLYVLPSRGEGLPRAILEAMAAGVPFVTTNIGGINDIVTKFQKQCLINFGDTVKFVAKSKEILHDSALARKLIDDGHRQVKKYDIANVAKLFYKLMSD